jgi:hypothetical protein
MAELTQKETVLYVHLKQAVEEWRDDSPWGDVYLDNVRGAFAPHEFAALLSNLSRKGLYRDSYDSEAKGIWGEVKATGTA